MSVLDKTIYITGLPQGTNVASLHEHFAKVGPVQHCAVKINESGEVNGDGFVVFQLSSDAARAIRDFSGRSFKDSNLQIKATIESQLKELEMLIPEVVKLIKQEPVSDPTDKLLGILGELDLEARIKALERLSALQFNIKSDSSGMNEYQKSGQTLTTDGKSQAAGSGDTPLRSDQLSYMHPMLPHIPRLPTFSGDDGNKGDVGFRRWKYEVKSLLHEGHSDATVLQSMRRSLRGTAADVLTWMSEDVTPTDILGKLDGLFGDVLTGESLLQQFYSERQKADESVAVWGCRLESLVANAIEKGKISPSAKNDMLKSKFWVDLYDDRLKNATRHKYDSIDDFAELCIAVRAIEHELAEGDKHKRKPSLGKVQSHQMTNSGAAVSKESEKTEQQLILEKLELLSTRMDKLETIPQRRSRTTHKPRRAQQHLRVAQVICYRCGKEGHVALGCRSPNKISEKEVQAIKQKQREAALNADQSLPRGGQVA